MRTCLFLTYQEFFSNYYNIFNKYKKLSVKINLLVTNFKSAWKIYFVVIESFKFIVGNV